MACLKARESAVASSSDVAFENAARFVRFLYVECRADINDLMLTITRGNSGAGGQTEQKEVERAELYKLISEVREKKSSYNDWDYGKIVFLTCFYVESRLLLLLLLFLLLL